MASARTGTGARGRQALKRSFVIEERGQVQVKGKGKVHTYFLIGPRGPPAATGSGSLVPPPGTVDAVESTDDLVSTSPRPDDTPGSKQ